MARRHLQLRVWARQQQQQQQGWLLACLQHPCSAFLLVRLLLLTQRPHLRLRPCLLLHCCAPQPHCGEFLQSRLLLLLRQAGLQVPEEPAAEPAVGGP
jgi:hypothetical protein